MARPHLAVTLAIVLVGGCAAPAPSASPAGPTPSTQTAPSMSPAVPSPSTPTTAASPSAKELYRDASLPVEARVDDLLARMTDDEKIGQMTLIEKDSIDPQAVGALRSAAS